MKRGQYPVAYPLAALELAPALPPPVKTVELYFPALKEGEQHTYLLPWACTIVARRALAGGAECIVLEVPLDEWRAHQAAMRRREGLDGEQGA